MVKCNFCGKEENHFKGIHYIRNDGNVNFFCSSKCRKNALFLKRDRKKLKWTVAYREESHKMALKEGKKSPEIKA
jgi:large subunit ribosomal protein L24e